MSDTAPAGLRYAPFLLVASVGYVTFGYSAIPSLIVERFDTTLVSVGLLMSAILLGFGLVQIPVGRFFDRSGTTRPLLVAGLLHVPLSVLLDLAPTFDSLLALRFGWALISGTIVVGGATHISRLYAGHTATRMQGIYGGVLTLGGALGFVVVPVVAGRTGWFGVHAVGGVLALPAVALLAGHATGSGAEHTRPERLANGAGSLDVSGLISDPAVAVAAVCYVAVLSSYISLSTFVTTYFADAGVLVSLNAVVLALAGLGRAAGGIGTEHWRVDDVRTIAAAAAAGTAGFLALAVADQPLLVALLPMATMVAVSVPFGAIYSVAARADVGEGIGLGVVLGVGNITALVYPAVTGALREATGSYESAFLLLAATNLVAAAVALWFRRR